MLSLGGIYLPPPQGIHVCRVVDGLGRARLSLPTESGFAKTGVFPRSQNCSEAKQKAGWLCRTELAWGAFSPESTHTGRRA